MAAGKPQKQSVAIAYATKRAANQVRKGGSHRGADKKSY
jgi:hypothetical protein